MKPVNPVKKDVKNPNEQNNEEKNDEKDENLNAVLKKFRDAAPSAFDSNKDRLIGFYKKIINKKYNIGEDFKEAANLIINFMNTPNVENGLKIECNKFYSFTFKGVRCTIVFFSNDEVKIVGARKVILNTIE